MNHLSTLPNEILEITLSDLPPEDLISVCSIIEKRITQLCQKTILPGKIRALTQGVNVTLPYPPENRLKEFIMVDAIYGSSKLGAIYMHPDWVCIQALKFGYMDLYREYLPFVTKGFASILAYFSVRYAEINYMLQKTRYQDYIDFWFDREVTDSEEFVKNTAQLTRTKIDRLISVSPNIIKNIVDYGDSVYESAIIERLKPFVNQKITPENYDDLELTEYNEGKEDKFTNLIRFYSPGDDKTYFVTSDFIGSGIAFEYLPAELFESYIQQEVPPGLDLDIVVKQIWAWNRWDLWSILLKYQDLTQLDPIDLLQLDQGLGHLSLFSLSLFHGMFPEVLSSKINSTLNYDGYLPLLQFCNRNNLPVPNVRITKPLFPYIFRNITYANSVNRKEYQISESFDTCDYTEIPFSFGATSYIEAQYVPTINFPPGYYISKTNFGRLLQLGAASNSKLNYERYFGALPSSYSSQLTAFKTGNFDNSTVEVALKTGEYINLSAGLSLSRVSPELKRKAYEIVGPTLITGNLQDIAGTIGKDNLTYKFVEALKPGVVRKKIEYFLEKTYKVSYIVAVEEFFGFKGKDARLFRGVLAKTFLFEDGGNYSIFELLYPNKIYDDDAEVILDSFVKTFKHYNRVVNHKLAKRLFEKFSHKAVGKMIPAMLSHYMTRIENPLGIFFDWLQIGKPYRLDADWSAKYYDIACLYGLHFLTQVCTPESVKTALLQIQSTPYVPESFKETAKYYLM